MDVTHSNGKYISEETSRNDRIFKLNQLKRNKKRSKCSLLTQVRDAKRQKLPDKV